jgi:eukaryotic-like serine/threonine-protein kinase
VGVGGMGAVYSARDLHFPNVVKRVAVKEMVNAARDPVVRDTIVRNFEREANILATLDHKSIPRIFDYFTYKDRSYLVLEYINGKDLESILNDTPGFLPVTNVVQWAVEICDVLNYLHNYKPEAVIFRDMKPSNVMINTHGHVMLVDFGIAKTFQSKHKGTMIGTEGYSPPEQYKGEAGPLSDVYALGATLHHLLTKRDPRIEPPFSFNERSIRTINSNVSVELETIINSTLQYNPEERIQSIQALKEAFLRILKESEIWKDNTPGSTPFIITDDMNRSIKPLWEFECEDEIRGTPLVEKGIVFIGAYDNNLYSLDAMSGNFNWKYPTEGGIVSKPSLFESNLFFGSEDGRLHVISANSGKLLWLYYSNGPIRSSPAIADGHVFIGSDDSHLHAINAFSGRSVWKLDAGAAVRSTPYVSSDRVYFGTEFGDLVCADFAGKIRWRFKAKRAITSSPVISNGLLYFGSVDSLFYAVDAISSYIIWRFRMSKPTISTPYIFDDLIFTGCVDGNIFCIDAHSAKEVWRFTTDHQVTGSPILYKDSIYCGSVDENLYCLDYRTGRLRWKFKTGGPITGTPAVFNDVIYIGSSDHTLYAIAT